MYLPVKSDSIFPFFFCFYFVVVDVTYYVCRVFHAADIDSVVDALSFAAIDDSAHYINNLNQTFSIDNEVVT